MSAKEVFYNAMVLREPYSGVEVTVHQLACSLAQFGSFPIRCCIPRGQREIPVPAKGDFRLIYASEKTARSRMMRILWEQTVLPVLLWRNHASLLHNPAYVSPLLTPCPTVVTIHDLHVMTHPQFCQKRNRLYFNLMIPQSVRKAAAVIVFSRYTKQTVLNRFPQVAERIHVIPPGLSEAFCRCTDFANLQRVKQKYRLPTSFLLFVGDMTSRKNISGLLSAFVIIQGERPDLHLVLAGANTPEVLASIERFTRQHDIRHRVRSIGYVNQTDLPVLYSLAQAFVFPSHDEGFGLPPLEAMACGCPVVCSGGAALDICGKAAVLCEPSDHTSIATAVSALLDHPDIRREKVEAGYKKASLFSWKKAALATEKVYRLVMGMTNGSRPKSCR